MKGKKAIVGAGARLIYGTMIAIMVWITMTQLLGPATDAAQDARSTTTSYGVSGLDCSNSSISDGTKATCVATDYTVFAWFIAVLAGMVTIVGLGFYNRQLPGN